MNKTLLALAVAAACGQALAAAVTDGTMGAVQSLSGNFTVPQTLGTLKGGNLFHSFGSFSIGASESATFLSSAGVSNVITRVTGTEASLLQGTLSLKAAGGAKPDFFLINPNGITVTAGAVFDLPAGLHLGAASQLRFADGSTWTTQGANASSLSVAAPDRFGFLGGEAALRWQGAHLQLAAGRTLDLAGGSVALDQAVLVAPDGLVRVRSPGDVALTRGAVLAATASNLTGAGAIDVEAGSLTIVGADGVRTGLLAQTGLQAQGRGLVVTLSGALTMAQGAEITYQGGSPSDNGAITITASQATLSADGLFTTIGSESYGLAPGPALNLRLSGALDLQGGDISTGALAGSGAAGAIDVQAGSIRLDGLGSFALGGINSYGNLTVPGSILVATPGALTMLNGGHVASNNRGSTDAPAVTVVAGSARLDGALQLATIGSLSSGAGRGADVQVLVSGTLDLLPGGQVAVGNFGLGAAGAIAVVADRIDMLGNHPKDAFTGIFNSALANDSGPGGSVAVAANRITIKGDAGISTSTLDSAAGAGDIAVSVGELLIDGQTRAGGIQSFAYGATGDAGRVQVDVSGTLTLLDGGTIMAGTLGRGAAGLLKVSAGELLIDGRNAPRAVTGILGDSLEFDGRRGTGASVDLTAGSIRILQGGAISTSTNTEYDAGSIAVKADSLLIDGGGKGLASTGITAITGGTGRAGSISIDSGSVRVIDEGVISTSTIAAGRGGALAIRADTLALERGGVVASVAAGRGNAGPVDLRVSGAMSITDGGIIAASSGGDGAAGRVTLQAGSLTITGTDPADGSSSRIASRALQGSGGDAGSIGISVDGAFTMGPGALLSIANDARVAEGANFGASFVRVQAGSIQMSGAEITAASSLNADAGAIALQSGGAIRIDNSLLRTSAHLGNGGPIGLQATGVVTLHNTAVTTSVDGVQGGDGGNIRIGGSALVLQSGFVQGNTVAAKGSGGDVTIDVPLLVPDGNNVFIGGNRIAQFRADTPGFNVIQAAAPNGLAGTLDVTTPDLNLSGALAALTTARIDFGLLGRDVCQIGFDSSFTPLGRGALPESSSAPLRLKEN